MINNIRTVKNSCRKCGGATIYINSGDCVGCKAKRAVVPDENKTKIRRAIEERHEMKRLKRDVFL